VPYWAGLAAAGLAVFGIGVELGKKPAFLPFC